MLSLLLFLFSGAGNTDGTLMVTCKSVNGKPLPAGLNYTIEVSSRYKCSDSQISASSVALRKVKNPVGLSTWHQGTGRTLVCADAGKATTTFNYRLTDDGVVKQAVLSATASSSIQGVTCTTNIGKGMMGKDKLGFVFCSNVFATYEFDCHVNCDTCLQLSIILYESILNVTNCSNHGVCANRGIPKCCLTWQSDNWLP